MLPRSLRAAAVAISLCADMALAQSSCSHDLENAPAIDRGDNVTLDLRYKLRVPPGWWAADGRHAKPDYDHVMQTMHGKNMWRDERLQKQMDLLGVVGDAEPSGSPLHHKMLEKLINMTTPRLFLEVGVFRGSTSIHVARYFDSDPRFARSFVMSMDTWLLDLRFVWDEAMKQSVGSYFTQNAELGGSSQMYFTFLANAIKAQASHRIIPLQTASQNGAMALINHKIRPDLMYIDASHSNPDVFVDYENFFTILQPGGVMAVDDIKLVPACAVAFEALLKRYGLTAQYRDNQAYVKKPRHFA